jgi:hypothetical protein
VGFPAVDDEIASSGVAAMTMAAALNECLYASRRIARSKWRSEDGRGRRWLTRNFVGFLFVET